MEQILRVDMTTRRISTAPLPEAYRYLGGRALTSRLVLDEVPPTCDPLGPENRLVMAAGLFGGTLVSSGNRVSMGAKSPLTGGIKESNGGGETAFRLAQLGCRALVVAGADPAGELQVLVLDREGARLEGAGALRGLGTAETGARLRERYGRQAVVVAIGPPGELRLRGAGVVHADRDGTMGRICARGGLGAVMGAKGLKAVVIRTEGLKPVAPRDPAAWKERLRAHNELLRTFPAITQALPRYGTAMVLDLVNKLGGLPTRNFSHGRSAGADRVGGNAVHDLIVARGGAGTPTHACMTGCVIRCSNVFPDAAGNPLVSPLEFETLGLLGTNLDITDLDAIARLNQVCNDLGLDTIEMGGALGVAMAAGVLPFGDSGAALAALRSVGEGTATGRILGEGAAHAAQVWGVARVPVVRNQTISAYDPRALKGNGVTYCTSPQGADHTAGNTVFAQVDHLDPAGKAELSRRQQVDVAAMEALGLCIMDRAPYQASKPTFAGLLIALYGWDLAADWLDQLGWATIGTELEFNRLAGYESPWARLPEFSYSEPLPPHGCTFDVPEDQLQNFWPQPAARQP